MSRKLSLAFGLSAILAAAVAAAAPASAQRSKDTIRLAINDMFPSSDPYNFPYDENSQFYRTAYQTLIAFDEHTGKFVPVLAKSFTRIDHSTIEMELRDDITFHNGDPFTADDVRTTFAWAGDPKTRVRFKNNYDWIKEVEVLAPHKIRIHAKEPNSEDMSKLAYSLAVLDGKVLAGLDNKGEYGRVSPIGTGPYKIDYVDRNKGILVERYAGYKGDTEHYRAPVKYVHGIPMPDRGTQKAQILTGGIDLLRNVEVDDAKSLAEAPNLKVTATASSEILYVTLDAAGRSGNKAMTDVRVREAFEKAIPRRELVKHFVPGGEIAEIPDAICFKETIACKPTTKPYEYDPAGAKKLLAEAGYANGLELELDCAGPVKQIAEAIAGEIRKVGFRATVRPLDAGLRHKMRGDGELTAFFAFYPTSSNPDASNILSFFFGADRDYTHDPAIKQAMEAGKEEFDLAKRAALYTPVLDLINTKAYVYPMSEMPIVWVHTKEVKLLVNPLSQGERRIGDFAWSDDKG